MTAAITNWSFSKLLSYEQCPLRVKYKYIDRLPEPERPADNPLERGNRIHKALELFVKGEGPMDREAKAIDAFKPMLEHLRGLYDDGVAFPEADWQFDRDWSPCAKDGYWLWAKIDYLALWQAEGLAVVGDYKSGKSQYKIVEHIQQTQLYAAVTVLKYDWVERVITEIPYVDEGHLKPFEYTREEALRFVGRFQARVDRMEADRFFRPNPNRITCKWCPYGRNGTGVCPVSA